MKQTVLLCLTTVLAACVGTPSFTPTSRGVLGALGGSTTTTQVEGGAPSVLDLTGPENPSYQLGPRDQVIVQVWGRPDLGSQIPVGTDKQISTLKDDGTIFLPFLGDITAGGRTVQDLTKLINRLYADVVDDPQVDIQIERCSSQGVLLTGAVNRPGKYFLCAGDRTIGDLVAAAGGPSEIADAPRATLSRAGAPFNLDYEAALGGAPGILAVPLQADDSIHFPTWDERQVYVFGEVMRQGAITIPESGMTLLRALAEAGGQKQTAKTKTIYLAQQRGNSFAIHELDFAEIMVNPEITLQDGDRVFIPPTDLERWNRWWYQALPFNFAVRTVPVG